MPIDIVGAFQGYLAGQLNIVAWEGEIPRYDTAGQPIFPGQMVSPSTWPVLQVEMPEQGYGRTWTMGDPYDDKGDLHVRVWGTTRASVLGVLSGVERILASETGWGSILTGGQPSNPNYVIQALLLRWSCFQEKGVRTDKSDLLYQGQMDYDVMVHGVISTA